MLHRNKQIGHTLVRYGLSLAFLALIVLVILALLVSLFEAVCALPAHIQRGLEKASRPSRRARSRAWFNKLRGLFRKVEYQLLRFRYPLIGLFVIAFGAALWYASNYMEFILFPTKSADYIEAEIELPAGTPLEATEQRVIEIEEGLQDLIATVRRITVGLRPEILDRLGFVAALRWNLERIREENGIEARVIFDGEEPTLDRRVSVALYRIFQESLRNVVTHAMAAHVLVSLDVGEGQVEMTIEDDGVGYESAAIRLQAVDGLDQFLRERDRDSSHPHDHTLSMIETHYRRTQPA